MKDNMEWQLSLKCVAYSEDYKRSCQFSGLVGYCLAWSEPGYYITGDMNINVIGRYDLDLEGKCSW